MKQRLVDRINQDRVAAGLRPVEFSVELSVAADKHAREMIREGYISHWNRDGWKPYLRYTESGILDYTAENIWSIWDSNFHTTPFTIEDTMLRGHRSFMSQTPPNDGHKRNVLNKHHTHVGIGVAFDGTGLRLVELFTARYATLKPLPVRAKLNEGLWVEGRISRPGYELAAISVYYEHLPEPMSLDALRATSSYGLPRDEESKPVTPPGWSVRGGSTDQIETDGRGGFRSAVRFWKKLPGVYTISIWVKRTGESEAFIGAQQSILVGEEPKLSRPHGPEVSAPPPTFP